MAVTGDVDVGPGGNINLGNGGGINVAQGGAIKVGGTFKATSTSKPVDGTVLVGTDTDSDTGAASPGLFYTDPASTKYGLRFKAGALVFDSKAIGSLPKAVSTEPLIVPPATQSGRVSVYANKLGLYAEGPTSANMAEVTSESVFLKWSDRAKDSQLLLDKNGAYLGRFEANLSLTPLGYSLKTNSGGSTPKTTSIATTGDGKLSIQASAGIDIVGTLTNNGAPISGAGLDGPSAAITYTNGTSLNNVAPKVRYMVGGSNIQFDSGVLFNATRAAYDVLCTLPSTHRPATFKDIGMVTSKGWITAQLRPDGTIICGTAFAANDYIVLGSIAPTPLTFA